MTCNSVLFKFLAYTSTSEPNSITRFTFWVQWNYSYILPKQTFSNPSQLTVDFRLVVAIKLQ